MLRVGDAPSKRVRNNASLMGNETGSIYCRPMPDTPPTDQRRLDAVAVDVVLRRLAKQPTAPWLHTEVARRMAERLQIIRLKPQRIIDWWSFLGASGGLLAEAYPDAQRVLVEPNEALA